MPEGITEPEEIPGPDSITGRQFHEAEGVGDWRVLMYGACAYFPVVSFAAGTALAAAIGELAVAAGHHADIDLRCSGVTVRLLAHPTDGLSQRDIELARQVSAAARALGLSAEAAAVQHVQVTIDALDIARVRPFWRALLGYREKGEEDLLDPQLRGPSFWFQEMDAPRTQRNRIHLDVSVPHDQAEARIAAALAAGGQLVSDAHAPSWWVLADPEGNEACVATWMGRG
jgi:4a-hydroxytetrahydrobiopterin dehydratase